MKLVLQRVFSDRLIEYAEAIPFSECRVINERKLSNLGFCPKTCIVFAIPYYAGAFPERNLSLYAIAKDYHLFFDAFSGELVTALKKQYPDHAFAAFADNSPIDERNAAAKAGLGVIGQNSLLINEKYGTYLFLGEVLTDLKYEEIGTLTAFAVVSCDGCGKCLAACPKKEICLSALTQKKGDITEGEREEIRSLGSVWGCDECQTVCPHNASVAVTPLAFFRENLLPCVTSELLESMSDEDFKSRAYAWRGKKTILRNLSLFS